MNETRPLRDGAYAGVGLTVLAIRQASEAFAELQERLGAREVVERGAEQARQIREQFEEALSPYIERAEQRYEQLIERLPERAQDTYRQALDAGRGFVEELEQFLRSLAGSPETTPQANRTPRVSAVA